MEKVALVIGAGASLAMGYPLGSSLRKQIFNKETYISLVIDEEDELENYQLDEFIDAFKKSQIASIDSFLARRIEFSEIGRKVIAAILLQNENPELLYENSSNDHWYFDFYQSIISDNTWDSLDLSHISIVTFNYDRSLEFYLMEALSALFKKPLPETYKKINEMQLVHVYGSLGTCDPNSTEFRRYGKAVEPKDVNKAASNIKVIPQSRNEDQSLIQARFLLENADRIAFLGFGFDELNLHRLDSENTCKASKNRKIGSQNVSSIRKIVATCVNKTNAEIEEINQKTAKYTKQELIYDQNFSDQSCSKLLRETLILKQKT